jgi:hypothetical protein
MPSFILTIDHSTVAVPSKIANLTFRMFIRRWWTSATPHSIKELLS